MGVEFLTGVCIEASCNDETLWGAPIGSIDGGNAAAIAAEVAKLPDKLGTSVSNVDSLASGEFGTY